MRMIEEDGKGRFWIIKVAGKNYVAWIAPTPLWFWI
jgi:hypothetical protein